MGAAHGIATVFGASGFLGRHIVQRLAEAGYRVRAAVRDVEGAKFLKPMGDVGQVVPLYAPVSDEAACMRAIEGAQIVINLAGILAESRTGDFGRTHAQGAGRVARLAYAAGARLVHVSAIGANPASASSYARSKGEGEQAVRAAHPRAAILRPSIVFGPQDEFFNRFAKMAVVSPILPVVYGETKFQPVFVGDVADAAMLALYPQAEGQIFELGGPEQKSFRALMRQMLDIIDRDCWIWDMPVGLARLIASLPMAGLTGDQIILLASDNVVAPGALGFETLGIAPKRLDLILPGYLQRYRATGRRHADIFNY
ncbi:MULTISPECIES: complex I NDUFA9 subunit family protein [unclassified Acidocella]|uniref:complex I NDUFA9 subunit family protein n=1 Tax=unclassified Acidocella TaxID=2648610 RepID=UPI00028CC6A9|nr:MULTISPECIES: complex I NDUFA9 subunit family protein [unclassified Acidocella]EKN00661.1 NADH dehydrogenase (ubiquinone) [Acidocella sp. MX-AZ02]WBO60180.1 complex I NDUFA9 subunit family protein [Acidocella sp. MX-AZ03]